MVGGTPREHGEKIADFPSYEAAQKAVSSLIAADIPAKDIAIVGRGLRSVETVTGRLGYAAAARSGAINGILLGLLFSAIFVLGSPNAGVQVFIGVMLVGIALGMLMSLITYSLLRRRRDYTSMTQIIADDYEVTVLHRSFTRAREVLGRGGPAAAPPPAPSPAEAAPPQYGERIDPDAGPPQYGERVDPAPSPPAEPEQDRSA
ncbi:general stress protein [Microbacterium sp.]|uniref:general stress protein n=1 Tax=Microbacterium sp. TaxID=51671 RepID=UPI003A87C20F